MCLEQNARLLVVKHKLKLRKITDLEQNARLLVVKHKLKSIELNGTNGWN